MENLSFAEELKLYAVLMGVVLGFDSIAAPSIPGFTDLRELATSASSGRVELLGAHIGIERFIFALGTCERYREEISPCLVRLKEMYPDSRAGMKPLTMIAWHYFLKEAAQRDPSSLPQSRDKLHSRLISLFGRLFPVDTLFPGDVPMTILMRPVAECLEGARLGHSFGDMVVGDLYLDPETLQSMSSAVVELVDTQLIESVGLSVRVQLSGKFLTNLREEKTKAS